MLAFSTLLLSHLTDGHGMHVCVLHLCVHMCFFSMLCILGGQRLTPGTILIHSPPQFWFRISHWTWNMPLGYTDWPVSPQCLQICVSPALGLQMVTLPWAFYVALRSSCSPIKHFTNLISPAFPTPSYCLNKELPPSILWCLRTCATVPVPKYSTWRAGARLHFSGSTHLNPGVVGSCQLLTLPNKYAGHVCTFSLISEYEVAARGEKC